MTETLTLELLPARHGDCILLSYPLGSRRAQILIDAGPAEAWDEIRPILAERTAGSKALDLFVITHVDTDHIEGSLMLTRDGPLGLSFADIWFNGYAHLESDRPDPSRGGVQGEYLAAVLDSGSWNEAFGREAARLWDSGSPVVVDAGDGAEAFTLLSPGREQSRRMAKEWASTCRKAKIPIGETDKVLALLDDDARYDEPDRGGSPAPPGTFGRDGSAPNGSSIAFLFEVGGRRLLLTGDAHAEVLTESISQLLATSHESTLHVDAFKLSHHGSRRNITPALLDLLDCDTFLVSTNGAKFHHPDKQTIELIASRAASAGTKPTIWFNYECDTTAAYAHDPRINAVYGTNGHATITF